MRSAWLLALAASGCRTILGIGDPPTRVDAGACATWHPVGFDPCALAITADALDLAGGAYTYDTTVMGGTLYDAAHQVILQSDQTILQADGSTVAVLSIGELSTAAATRLSVIGPRPLLLVSWSTLAVDGELDAGSHLGITDVAAHVAETVQFGPGANQGCTASAGGAGSDASGPGGSGGGGGGGLQGGGGLGGSGDGPVVAGGAAGVGLVGAPLVIRGGCPGGTSGAAGSIAQPPAAPGARALGGAGGGALRLVARDSIDVRGAISASGAGGAGSPTSSACGGGGGGGGGYLGFEAPIVMLGGTISANGGGGGGGGRSNGTGSDGADGALGVVTAAGGGGAPGCGGDGGDGAAAMRLGGGTAIDASGCQGGGGGGGGGTGVIVVHSPDYHPGTATLSPAATVE